MKRDYFMNLLFDIPSMVSNKCHDFTHLFLNFLKFGIVFYHIRIQLGSQVCRIISPLSISLPNPQKLILVSLSVFISNMVCSKLHQHVLNCYLPFTKFLHSLLKVGLLHVGIYQVSQPSTEIFLRRIGRSRSTNYVWALEIFLRRIGRSRSTNYVWALEIFLRRIGRSKSTYYDCALV